MTIKTVLFMVSQEYEKAKQNSYVQKPLAYALYKVWRAVDQQLEEDE